MEALKIQDMKLQDKKLIRILVVLLCYTRENFLALCFVRTALTSSSFVNEQFC